MEESDQFFIKDKFVHYLSLGVPLQFHKGQALFYEGHVPYGIFVIRSGRVSFQKEGAEVKDLLCQNLIWSSEFGKIPERDHFFDQTPFCCTCIAEEDCEVTFIPKSSLKS